MSLVQASKDPRVYAYVTQNLGKEIRTRGSRTACGITSKALLKGLAQAFASSKPLRAAAPSPPKREIAFPVVGKWADYTMTSKNVRTTWFMQRRPTGAWTPPPMEMELVVPEPRQPTAWDLLPRDPKKLQELIDGPVRELMLRAPRETILEKLKSKEPLMRWLAIQVISRKRLHVEREVIATLRDKNPVVRQAAREALVRLSRGSDFGPSRKATPKQFANSIEAWEGWLSIQDRSLLSPPAEKKKL